MAPNQISFPDKDEAEVVGSRIFLFKRGQQRVLEGRVSESTVCRFSHTGTPVSPSSLSYDNSPTLETEQHLAAPAGAELN